MHTNIHIFTHTVQNWGIYIHVHVCIRVFYLASTVPDVACVAWLIHMCDMPHAYVWRDSYIRGTWRIPMHNMTIYTCGMPHSPVWHDSSPVWPDSYTRGVWHIHMCHTIHSHICRIQCTTAQYHRGDTTRFYAGQNCVLTWLTHMTGLMHTWDMTYSYVWHDSFTCGTLPVQRHYVLNWCHELDTTSSAHNGAILGDNHDSCILLCMCLTRLIYMWDMPHTYVRHDFSPHVWHDAFIYMTHSAPES